MVGFVHENGMCYAGKHLLIDFYQCEHHGDLPSIQTTLIEACKATGATVLFSHLHPFEGGGASGAVILAESHMSIHTWVTEQYVALDVFVCGVCDPMLAVPILANHFKPLSMSVKLEKRGTQPTPGQHD
jgi:S-adenosylmethionine decarboxylase